mmetsp:Transcript_15426/g.37997  ORF Transcript_15426/g.37997 Transcript_15426/m.37997 type:complete len:306 (+) Transcript_15426:163-1080(+)
MKRSFKSEEQASAQEPSSVDESQNDDPPDDSEVGPQNDLMDKSNHSDSASGIVPDDNCILFGRGKGTNNRPANKRMRLIIDKYRDEYHIAKRGGKCKVVRKAHGELVERGMKFMKQAEGESTWVEVDTDAAIQKVGHALRSTKQDKQQKETVRRSPPSVSNNPPWAQEAQAALDGGSIQASAPTFGEANMLAQRGLTGMPLPMGQNMLLDSVLGVTGTRGTGGYAALGTPSSLLSLESSHLMEMEMNRLRSVVPMSMGVVAPRHGNLNGLSTSQLLLLIEEDQRLRQMLQNYSSVWPGQFPGPPP